MLKVVSSTVLHRLQQHIVDWTLSMCLVVPTLYLPIHNTQVTMCTILTLYTKLTWCKRVKWLKCRQFFEELLYKRTGS